MQKSFKLIITKFYYFVPLVLFLLVIIYLSGLNLSGTSRKKLDADVKQKRIFLEKVSEVWRHGDFDSVSKNKKGECKTLLSYKEQVSEEFYQCNPLFFNCYLENVQFKDYRPTQYKKRYFKFDHLGHPIVNFSNGEKSFKLKLFNTCRDVYLPKKKYSAGLKEEQEYIWDNLDQEIFIDKYYVTNQDVLLWKERTSQKISEQEQKQLPYVPNTSLDAQQMNEYCYSLGKKVVESRYFDAASYIPTKEINPKLIKKFPYHWTKKRSLSSLDCFNVYHKTCENKRAFKFFEGLSTSWIGMHYVLGGYMEYLPNKFVKDKDLKVSSFYMDEKSPWHEIGKRGSLGKDNRTRLQKDIGVAFRCMSIK